MKIIKPSFEIMTPIDGPEILRFIEKVGRTCYKSEEKISEESYKAFISKLVERNHEAMLEHFNITVKFICDRGVSHELVRHRIASFAQESTRYCNYGSEKKGMTFIQPCWFKTDIIGDYDPDFYTQFYKETGTLFDPLSDVTDSNIRTWFDSMMYSERVYNALVKEGWKPEQARSILPNSLKTEIVVTTNCREWMHIFRLRAASTAHPQMRELMHPLLNEFYSKIPIMFDEIYDNIFHPID